MYFKTDDLYHWYYPCEVRRKTHLCQVQRGSRSEAAPSPVRPVLYYIIILTELLPPSANRISLVEVGWPTILLCWDFSDVSTRSPRPQETPQSQANQNGQSPAEGLVQVLVSANMLCSEFLVPSNDEVLLLSLACFLLYDEVHLSTPPTRFPLGPHSPDLPAYALISKRKKEKKTEFQLFYHQEPFGSSLSLCSAS